MRVLRSKKKRISAIVGGAAMIGTLAAVALGSSGSGFTFTTLAQANLDDSVHFNSDRVKFQTKDPTIVRTQKVVIAAGGFSGWHHHPGIILVSVQSGSVTVEDSHCNSRAYGAGQVFVEAGDDPLQVTSVGGATEYVTQVAPQATPPVFRNEDAPPPCA